MKIFYILSAYISHRQAGLEYISCLKSLGHEVACNYPLLLSGREDNGTLLDERSYEFALDPARAGAALEADLIILHEDPAWHDKIFGLLPGLEHKPSVICLPWENATLPEAFIRPLKRARAIWTPSEFCRQAFSAAFDNVHVLPHVVLRPKPGAEAINWARSLLAEHGVEDSPIFFSAVDGLNPRKNLEGLLTAFSLFRKASRAPGRLLLKQYRAAMPLRGQERVISIADDLDNARMAALYAICTAYVSTHRGEGWGLGLSTAMSFGKIAIATAYSGNLEFMDSSNSLLVPYTLEQVSLQMEHKIPLFTTAMRWAAPDLGAMAGAMRQVAEGRIDPAIGRNAAEITRRFGPKAIAGRLAELLGEID
jgi:glycosyltransferase involved in cell wall biosynthesis